MTSLTQGQQDIVDQLVAALGGVDGVVAIVLGGSHARGYATAESDIDLGLWYSDRRPLPIAALREVAARVNDTAEPVVTGLYEWGRWVNGGAWLTIGGQRVDWLYRRIEHLERSIADATAGRWELDYGQQPPFGFFSPTYLGEIDACFPLHDPQQRVAALKQRVRPYPEALRHAVVGDCLWAAEFALRTFAPKFAQRADAYLTAGCMARVAHQLVLALFAMNHSYFVNDKTALAEIAYFACAPVEFGTRLQAALSHLGRSTPALSAAVGTLEELFAETVALAGGLYRPRFSLPH